MRNGKTRWLSGLGTLILIGGLLSGCGSSDDAAIAQSAPADLSSVAQNWDKAISGAGRFTVLSAFGNAAVRDNETGLVWERSPALSTHTWSAARFECTGRATGNRKGWRQPSMPELASLVDPTVNPGPTLPSGHPFTNVQSAEYWSATTNAEFPTTAWLVNFDAGLVNGLVKSLTARTWCVRGGMQESVY